MGLVMNSDGVSSAPPRSALLAQSCEHNAIQLYL